ncbi:FAD-dependent oxidoreductase [Gilvimarinus polysaccharolyticus]|uniref:FAD-dependent oxidoreductase n=1 Tax=Gilvimarinus polysaccharolyticus TaxID=863921 RepID=UPI0006735AB3|nr:FAD-dependent oxidoreductase [Gilvimarinus polysaccharolyticus]
MKVAVVGAGVVGRLAALQLVNKGVAVTLFEKTPLSVPHNAAHVSAGMLCPISEIIHAPKEVAQMGLWGVAQWPKLLQQLQLLDPQQEPVFFQAKGSLVVAFDADRQCFAQLKSDLTTKATDYAANIDWLTENELHQLEPSLHNFKQASFLKPEAQLCNRAFLAVSTRALQQHCVIYDNQEISVSKLQQLTGEYDWVVDARGANAIGQEHHQNPVGPLRGVRGEVIRVHCPEATLSRPVRVLHPRHAIYIVPKPGGEFVIGATEVESSSEHNITVKSTLELLSTLYSVNPMFSEARVLEASVGIRAAYLDNVPNVSIRQRVIVANGLYRHGWLMGPAIANQIVDHVIRRESENIA